MTNIRKRIIAIAVLACMALSSIAGCSNNSVGKGTSATKTEISGDDSSSTESSDTTTAASAVEEITLEKIENEQGMQVATPFTVGSSSGDNPFNLSDPEDGNASVDTTEPPTTKIENVVVTDAAGAAVTDAAGAQVTETVVVTAPVNNNTSEGDYKTETDSMYALWLDISQDADYVFNDQYIKITFKIKDGIPNKDYAVRFNPDFSNNVGKTIHPDKVAQGTIRVGSGDIEPMDVSGDEGFVAYGDNIACNQGDTIDYYINLKNNPGLVATLLWFYYDKNAMEVVSVAPAGEFADIAKKTTVGQKDE